MKIISIKINNYKSIGNEKNTLNLEKNVTSIIGKNESGKSNILEAISNVNFHGEISKALFIKKSRFTDEELTIELKLETNKEDYKVFKRGFEETTINISSNGITIDGGLFDFLENDVELSKSFEYLNSLSNNNSLSLTERENFKKNLSYLNQYKTVVIYNIKQFCETIKRNISSLDMNIKEEVINHINKINDYLNNIYSRLPTIYYRNKDLFLDNTYSYENIKKLISENNNNIFKSLMKAAKINENDINNVFDPYLNGGQKMEIKAKIQSNVREYIEKGFNDFYKQEKIEIITDITGNIFHIYIKSNEKIMEFSERSNGLKWYISLFIDMLSNDIEDKIVLYLIDEPGVFLHVDAQKELLKFFNNLCNNDNQLIYTTHSPYMINDENILNIRAVQKDEGGLTSIYNSVYDSKIDKTSKKETLSPLLNAIGTSMKYNIGPNVCKNNVITEGITDYMYIKAMLLYLKIKENRVPYIIPSTGAGNVDKIASILLGWGYDFIALVDYDEAGYNCIKKLKSELGLELNKNVFYINCESSFKSILKDDYKTMESLISKEDNDKLEIPYNKEDSTTKKLSAKNFFDKVSSSDIVLTQETLDNFSRLFKTIGIIE